MAKKKKRKRRPISLLRLTVLSISVSGALFLFSSIGLRTYNNWLSMKTQSLQSEISVLSMQNIALDSEIRVLASGERIETVVANAGLSYNADNVIPISR